MRRLLYRLKHRWRDGTTHVLFTPSELVEKLAALIPPLRFHLVRYHGALGPCASDRDRIVPAGANERQAQSAPRPELDSTPDHVESDSACAASLATPDSASIELLASMRDRALLATPPAIPLTHAGTPPKPDAARVRRLAWAELMKRVFAIDVLACPRCRGPMRILARLGLPVRAPPLAPARCDDGVDDEAADPSSSDLEF